MSAEQRVLCRIAFDRDTSSISGGSSDSKREGSLNFWVFFLEAIF